MERKQFKENITALLHGALQKKNAIFYLGLVGILLIFCSDWLFSSGKNEETPQPVPEPQAAQPAQTEQELEQRLAEMIGAVQGVGKVRVMVTLENDGEMVYASDEQSDTETALGADGVTERRQAYENQHVLIDAAGGTQPLVETSLQPEVKGAAVVCEGGDDITVIKRVTELVSVVLRLPTNRVCVIKMTETEDAS